MRMIAKRVTIYDIAKELGINPCTVSRAFHDPSLVKEETRNLIFEKAKEMGYRKNLVASQLRSRFSNIIALVVLQPEWSWFTDKLANGVQDAANKLGYEVLVMRMDGHHTNCVQLCEQMNFAGVIVASTEIGYTKEYASDAIPTVYINRLDVEKNLILPDDASGINSAVDYLYACGHTRIAYIDGPASSLHSVIRRKTFLERTQQLGLTVYPEWLAAANWNADLAHDVARQMLLLANRPTAILAADDNMCCGVYRAAYELGLKVGEDVSVVGYDNADTAFLLSPGLTTFSFPLYEMGFEAVKMVDSIVRQQPFENRITVHGELIKRASVKVLR